MTEQIQKPASQNHTEKQRHTEVSQPFGISIAGNDLEHRVMQLQRLIGNKATQALLRQEMLQREGNSDEESDEVIQNNQNEVIQNNQNEVIQNNQNDEVQNYLQRHSAYLREIRSKTNNLKIALRDRQYHVVKHLLSQLGNYGGLMKPASIKDSVKSNVKGLLGMITGWGRGGRSGAARVTRIQNQYSNAADEVQHYANLCLPIPELYDVARQFLEAQQAGETINRNEFHNQLGKA